MSRAFFVALLASASLTATARAQTTTPAEGVVQAVLAIDRLDVDGDALPDPPASAQLDGGCATFTRGALSEEDKPQNVSDALDLLDDAPGGLERFTPDPTFHATLPTLDVTDGSNSLGI